MPSTKIEILLEVKFVSNLRFADFQSSKISSHQSLHDLRLTGVSPWFFERPVHWMPCTCWKFARQSCGSLVSRFKGEMPIPFSGASDVWFEQNTYHGIMMGCIVLNTSWFHLVVVLQVAGTLTIPWSFLQSFAVHCALWNCDALIGIWICPQELRDFRKGTVVNSIIFMSLYIKVL